MVCVPMGPIKRASEIMRSVQFASRFQSETKENECNHKNLRIPIFYVDDISLLQVVND